MEQTKISPDQKEDEVSLKELILKGQDWWRYLLKKWVLILIVGLAGAGLGLTYSFLSKPRYEASLTFVLEDGKSSPLGAYAGLASQFGIDLGNSSGSGVFTGDNILEFLRSRLIVEKALLSNINGNSGPSLADLYMQAEGWKERWAENEKLKNISFPANLSREKYTRLQDSVLNLLYKQIIKANLSIIKPDKKLTFIAVTCYSRSELFAQIFTTRLVKEATSFYVQTKTQRSKANVDKLQAKADSLEIELSRKAYSVAAAQDLNINPIKRIATVRTEMGSIDKMVVQTMYGEVIKNLELSKMSMSQETPVIQIIDTPILPLEKKKFGKLKGLVGGGMLAGFICVFLLILIKIYKQIMAK